MTSNQRIYLDYNATAPLCVDLSQIISTNPLLNYNPSSSHTSGKKLRKIIQDTKIEILKIFGLDDHEYDVVLNSGATESINTLINPLTTQKVYFSDDDHSAVIEASSRIKKSFVYSWPNLDHVTDGVVNITYIHNESGIVKDKSLIENLATRADVIVHLDCAQLVGKIKDWNVLPKGVDVYTFSAHKFGAPKGVGFSILKKDLKFSPLLVGGAQQKGLRAGTENPLGLVSTLEALVKYLDRDYDGLLELKSSIISLVENRFADDAFVIDSDSVNTCLIIFKKHKADFVQMLFDLEGLDVSFGSACSSESIKKSQHIINCGHEDYALNGIRVSFGEETLEHRVELLKRLNSVFDKLC